MTLSARSSRERTRRRIHCASRDIGRNAALPCSIALPSVHGSYSSRSRPCQPSVSPSHFRCFHHVQRSLWCQYPLFPYWFCVEIKIIGHSCNTTGKIVEAWRRKEFESRARVFVWYVIAVKGEEGVVVWRSRVFGGLISRTRW